jgi:hypothetical protein
MDMREVRRMKKFKWVVEITVDETWVADGVNLTKDSALSMVQSHLPFATSNEFKVKILKAPDKKDIKKAQGY